MAGIQVRAAIIFLLFHRHQRDVRLRRPPGRRGAGAGRGEALRAGPMLE